MMVVDLSTVSTMHQGITISAMTVKQKKLQIPIQ